MPRNSIVQFWQQTAEQLDTALTDTDLSQVKDFFNVTTELRQVPNAPRYAVSADGRVFSGAPCSRDKSRFRELKPITSPFGYKYVRFQIMKRSTTNTIHRLLASAFLPPPKPGQTVVRHLNGDPGDNRLENLSWGTQAENMQDCVRHGRSLRGMKNPNAKLTPKRVALIRGLNEEGFRDEVIAHLFGVSRETVRRATRLEAWVEA